MTYERRYSFSHTAVFFYVCYLDYNSYLRIKVLRKLSWQSELLGEHELRAKGIWKPWGIFHSDWRGGGAGWSGGGILQCLNIVSISCETWLLVYCWINADPMVWFSFYLESCRPLCSSVITKVTENDLLVERV